MGVGDGMGVTVIVGIGVKVGKMGAGVFVGVDVNGAITAVHDVRSTRVMQAVKRKIVMMGCWRIGAILPSESVLKIIINSWEWHMMKLPHVETFAGLNVFIHPSFKPETKRNSANRRVLFICCYRFPSAT
jgi:hypothetical protein